MFFFRHNFNKSLCKNIFLLILHLCTSPLGTEPPQLTLFSSPTTCMLDNFQRLIFGNSQSPNKFTGNPKTFSHLKISQERQKHKLMFTFTRPTVYPSTRSMACHIFAARGGKLFRKWWLKTDRNKSVPSKW